MIESPNKMYDKLKHMLNKNDDTLHGFIELGGLAKIYECLCKFYNNKDENQIIRWLELLDHDNFPIDTELIRNIGLGSFINKHLSQSHSKLTSSITKKWYNFAKAESQQISSRQLKSNKRVSINETCQSIIFKRTDKPSNIKPNRKFKHKQKNNKINSILKSNNNNMNNIKISNESYQKSEQINNTSNKNHKNQNVDGEYLEYVGIDDDDIAMCDSQNTEDDDDDDDTLLFNNDCIDEIRLIQWNRPMKMKIDCFFKINTNFRGMREEEERIRYVEEKGGGKCIELGASMVVNKEMNTGHRIMPTDYPHWSEIQKYRKQNNE